MPGLLLDMPALDVAEARAFYRDVLGWESSDAEYPSFGDGTFTGFFFEGQGSTAWPLVVVTVPDLEATLALAIERGATIEVRRSQEGGESAIIHDPSGNRLGLWQSTEPGDLAGPA